jgi:serine/threonine protein kinase
VTVTAPEGRVPTTDELQAFSLGNLDSEREREIELHLAEHPECALALEAAPDDELVSHLRGAGDLPRSPVRSPLMQLAIEAVMPVLGGCAGAVVGGAEGGLVGVAAGQVVEKAINFFGLRIVEKWLGWLRKQPAGLQAAALTQLSEVLPEVARSEVTTALEQKAPQASPADRQLAIEYLSAIPRSVRRSLLSDRERGGRTLPPRLSVDDSFSLLQLLPTSVPPYSTPAPLPGTDYRLEELIGTGGFGAVYRARGSSLQHVPLAIKFCLDRGLLPALRYERENLEQLMKAGGESWSPRLVRLYGYNLEHDTPFLIYEYASGGDLARWLATRQARDGRGPTPDEVLDVIVQVAEALAFAHDRRLVHRDLKPANVLIADGAIKLADFGIGGLIAGQAVQQSQIGTVAANRLSPIEQASLFRGAGTPLYMSEEQQRGDNPDPRHDLYSLGVMWYQLLVGDVTRKMHPGWARELEVRYAVPPEHVSWIAKCVGWIEERPKNAGELLKLLRPSAEKSVEGAKPEPRPIAVSSTTASPVDRGQAATLTGDRPDVLREKLLQAVITAEKPDNAGNWGCFGLCLFLAIAGALSIIPFCHNNSWGGAIASAFSSLVLTGVAIHYCRAALSVRDSSREALGLAIESTSKDLSLPTLLFDRHELAELRRTAWDLVRDIENAHVQRATTVQLVYAGGNSLFEGNKFNVLLDSFHLGEGTFKNGFDFGSDGKLRLCRGKHCLVVRHGMNEWPAWFDVARDGRCRAQVSWGGAGFSVELLWPHSGDASAFSV